MRAYDNLHQKFMEFQNGGSDFNLVQEQYYFNCSKNIDSLDFERNNEQLYLFERKAFLRGTGFSLIVM